MYVPLGNRNATMTRESLNGEGIRASLAQASTKGVPRGMENSITRQFDSAGYFLEGVGNPVTRNSVTVPVGKNIFTFARRSARIFCARKVSGMCLRLNLDLPRAMKISVLALLTASHINSQTSRRRKPVSVKERNDLSD